MYNDDSFATGYALGRDSNDNNNGFGWGGDWAWIIILFLIFGWGNGNGFGFGNNGGNMTGYELGKLATTNDVASGFSTSEIMSDLNDIILGQAQMQNFINQGFAGVNQTVTSGFAGVNNAICTLGYQNQAGFNSISREIADCCCTTQRAIDGVNYNMAKNTCDIIRANQDNTREILNFLTGEKISSLQAENSALTAQLSQNAQTRTIIDSLLPVARPAYLTCSPYASAFGTNGSCNCGL